MESGFWIVKGALRHKKGDFGFQQEFAELERAFSVKRWVRGDERGDFELQMKSEGLESWN